MRNLDIGSAILTYFGLMVAITMHEAGEALVAKWLGDKSASTQSRATLNPLPHIDPVGTVAVPLVMLLLGVPLLFGWAKPLLVDSRYFKHMRRDINLTALAGPGLNYLIAIAMGLGMRVGRVEQAELLFGKDPFTLILHSTAVANLIIGTFNLLPFPNSDGWKVLINSVSYNTSRKLQELAPMAQIGFLVLLILGVWRPLFTWLVGTFYGLVYLGT